MWCMNIRYKTRLWVIMAIIGSFFLLQQSAFPWNWSQGVKDELIKRSGAEYVRGWVECGAPVTDVEIRVYDESGRLLNLTFPLQDSPLYTGASGVFAVALQNLPDHFRIKAIGGFCGDDMFSEMEADIWYFNPEQDLIHINPVTTLLARYIDRYPDIGYEEAQARVKQFLLIPERIDLSYGPDIPEIHFSPEVFLGVAEDYGGIDPFIDLLLEEMEADPLVPRSFVMLGVDGGWGKWAGDKIAGGLVSGLTSKAFGYFLSEIGFPDDNKKILEGIKEIKRMLSQIMDMIAIVSSQLEDARAQLSMEISQSNYDIRVSQAGLGELIRTIENISERFSWLADSRVDGSNPEDVKKDREYIKKRIEDYLIHHLDAIHYEQSGKTPGQTPLIEVWCKIAKGTRRFLGPEHSKLMKRQFDSFAAFQVSLFSMALEYYAAKGYSEQYIEDHIVKIFTKNMEEQFSLLPLTIPEETIVETNSGMMIAPYRIWNPPYDTGMTNDKKIKIYLALDNCNHYSSKNFMGFSDWRPPRPSEVQNMFYGSPGRNLATWAISKGYPEDYLNNNVVILLQDALPRNYTYSYYLVDGRTSGVMKCYRGGREQGGGKRYRWWYCLGSYIEGPTVHFFPVRKPLKDERYYY